MKLSDLMQGAAGVDVMPGTVGFYGNAVDDLITRSVKRKNSRRMNELAMPVIDEYNALPGGTRMDMPPASATRRAKMVVDTLNDIPSLPRNLAKGLPAGRRQDMEELIRRNDAYKAAMENTPTIRRLMAQRGFITPQGITLEGMRFLEAMQTGGYGLD